jgi:hypothetical protein
LNKVAQSIYYCFEVCNSNSIDGLPLWASRILAFQLQPNLIIRQLYYCYNWSCATSLVTGAQVGAIGDAIAEYAAAAGKSVKRDQVGSDDAPGSNPYHDAYQRYRQKADRNVSKNSTTAAASDHQPKLPADAELEAMGALLQAPSPTFDVHVGG